MLGFGTRSTMLRSTDPIILDGTSGATHLAFPMPDDGNVTALSAFVNVAAAPLTEGLIVAELYASPDSTNSFVPVPGARVEMPISTVAIGTPLHGSTGKISASIKKDTRLLMVFYFTTSTTTKFPGTLVMHMSAGLKIELPNPEEP